MAAPITLLSRKNYEAMIKNSVGSALFRNLYATQEGREEDIVQGGALSCALFVSSILHHFKLIETPHATVAGTVADMRLNGWKETERMDDGAVLVWEEAQQAGGRHIHIGFYIGDGRAVSNSSDEGVPTLHDQTFGGTRKITSVFSHPFLKGESA